MRVGLVALVLIVAAATVDFNDLSAFDADTFSPTLGSWELLFISKHQGSDLRRGVGSTGSV